MLYFSVLYKEKNHQFLLRQFQIINGITLIARLFEWHLECHRF